MPPQRPATIQTIAMPENTNPNGDIFGGWLLSQMDLAGWAVAKDISQGRVTTVALTAMKFINPVQVGDVVSCYTTFIKSGRTSMTFEIEAWVNVSQKSQAKAVTTGTFVFVAIDKMGKPRPLASSIANQSFFSSKADITLPPSPHPEARNHFFIFALLGLSSSLIALAVGLIAVTGVIVMAPLVSATCLSFGGAGVGFFAASIQKTPEAKVNTLISLKN